MKGIETLYLLRWRVSPTQRWALPGNPGLSPAGRAHSGKVGVRDQQVKHYKAEKLSAIFAW